MLVLTQMSVGAFLVDQVHGRILNDDAYRHVSSSGLNEDLAVSVSGPIQRLGRQPEPEILGHDADNRLIEPVETDGAPAERGIVQLKRECL